VRTPGERLTAWARPRRRSIIGGLAPLIVGLVAFGIATNDPWPAVAGFGGILVAAIGLCVLVAYPHLWARQRRWGTFAIFVGLGTFFFVVIVIVFFVAT